MQSSSALDTQTGPWANLHFWYCTKYKIQRFFFFAWLTYSIKIAAGYDHHNSCELLFFPLYSLWDEVTGIENTSPYDAWYYSHIHAGKLTRDIWGKRTPPQPMHIFLLSSLHYSLCTVVLYTEFQRVLWTWCWFPTAPGWAAPGPGTGNQGCWWVNWNRCCLKNNRNQ